MSSINPLTPDRVSPTSSFDQGSQTDRDSQTQRASPSILEHVSLRDNSIQVPESTHHQSSQELGVQYSETYTQDDEDGSHDQHSNGNGGFDTPARLDTFLRFGEIADRDENSLGNAQEREPLQSNPMVENEDSNTASSTSEESNHFLREIRAQNNDENVLEPPTKVRKINSPKANEDLDGETCPICLDTWGNSGSHRLVALKCGHLFGAECVERWLKAQLAKDRSCPTCKSKAALKDLRFIYARRLIAADTSEITRLQKEVETLQAGKSRTELELQAAKITQRALAAQLEDLKKSIAKSQVNKQEDRRLWRFALEKNLEICKDGGCRVLTYNCRTYELYVSQKSANYLFPGYGIRKVSCVDYTLGQFVYLHPKPIRDIKYSQPSDLLLSVGLDSTARIVERGIPNVTVNARFPLWSCSWDHHRNNEFYVGGVGGMIQKYDYRNPSTCLNTLSGTGDMSPVVSICSTEFGLLSCQLNSCWLWGMKDGEWKPQPFPITGPFMSMCYDGESQKALISARPSGSERSKLFMLSLSPTLQGNIEIDVCKVINGSARTSVMSRSTFCRCPSSYWVAAHSESDATLYLHGMEGSRTMSLPAAEPALDVCSLQINGNCVLAALSESRLRIYKAVQTGG